jgi:hypothetical protein
MRKQASLIKDRNELGIRRNEEVWSEGMEKPAHRQPSISGSLAKVVKVPSKVLLSGCLEVLGPNLVCELFGRL